MFTLALISIGMAEFKTQSQNTSFEVLVNPKTTKLFVSGSSGNNYKVEQGIELKNEVVWLVEDGNLDEACLINKRTQATVLATF